MDRAAGVALAAVCIGAAAYAIAKRRRQRQGADKRRYSDKNEPDQGDVQGAGEESTPMLLDDGTDAGKGAGGDVHTEQDSPFNGSWSEDKSRADGDYSIIARRLGVPDMMIQMTSMGNLRKVILVSPPSSSLPSSSSSSSSSAWSWTQHTIIGMMRTSQTCLLNGEALRRKNPYGEGDIAAQNYLENGGRTVRSVFTHETTGICHTVTRMIEEAGTVLHLHEEVFIPSDHESSLSDKITINLYYNRDATNSGIDGTMECPQS